MTVGVGMTEETMVVRTVISVRPKPCLTRWQIRRPMWRSTTHAWSRMPPPHHDIEFSPFDGNTSITL
jgi:hypothetical protein